MLELYIDMELGANLNDSDGFEVVMALMESFPKTLSFGHLTKALFTSTPMH